MASCKATLIYNIPNSDGTDNWRTAECGKLKSDDERTHRDGDDRHEDVIKNKTWYGPMDGETRE